MDSAELMLVVLLYKDSSVHSNIAIRRLVSAVQKHNGLRATQILVLGFPQQKQQKRPCCTSWHECRKPTNASNTPQMARRFYPRPRLLCRLELWGLFTSSRFVILQSPMMESSLTPLTFPHSRPHIALPWFKKCVINVDTILLLLRFVFSQPAIAISYHFWEWQAGVGMCDMCAWTWRPQFDCTASETVGKSNGTIPTTTGAQWVRIVWTTGATGENYSSATGIGWL